MLVSSFYDYILQTLGGKETREIFLDSPEDWQEKTQTYQWNKKLT